MEIRGKGGLWVLTRDGDADLVTLRDRKGAEALPVFGFEDEARMYVLLLGRGAEWGIRETTAGELAPLLRGPYSGVERIALDPVPTGVDCSGPLDVAWPNREDFLHAFRVPARGEQTI